MPIQRRALYDSGVSQWCVSVVLRVAVWGVGASPRVSGVSRYSMTVR